MANNVGYTEAADINSDQMLEKISSFGASALVVIAFGQFIKDRVLELFDKGAYNVHGSLLPKYRGAAPVNWAVINGEKETGISIITVVKKMDAGDILATASTPIHKTDTAGTVHDRLSKLAPDCLVNELDKIERGEAAFTEQDESKVSFAPKLSKSDGQIDFRQNSVDIFNKIRGMNPWPGAYGVLHSSSADKDHRVMICFAETAKKSNPKLKAGYLDENLNVVCGKGALKIRTIKPAGKRTMSFEDFVNGRSIRTGDYFILQDEDRG
jgi:methionyl-tRNA formyltransferase